MKRLAFPMPAAAMLLVLVSFIAAPAPRAILQRKNSAHCRRHTAGGGYDTYTRTIARHLSKHIPGNPNILVENMAGAGHRIGANHVYKVAKPDGLTLGHFQGSLFLAQALGEKGIEFDTLKYEFIGAPVRDTRACAVTKASGVTNMEAWFASKTPVKLGGIGLGATEEIPRMLKGALGLPIQIISGYKGTA